MDSFNKYIWLLNLIRRNPYITFREISNEWFDAEGRELPRSSFNDWKERIRRLFSIDISCDATRDYGYYIENIHDLNEDKVSKWLISTYTTCNMLEKHRGLYDRIILDNVPSGEEYLTPILNAMKAGKRLSLVYKRFQEDKPRPAEIVEPYCVRQFDKRWYAVVNYVSGEGLKVISLDRIDSLTQTSEPFTLPKDFSAKEYFSNVYGIAVGLGGEPETVRLRISAWQRPYTLSLPLHHSQREVLHTKEYSEFEYFVKPNRDFARAILPYGKEIKVIKPDSLRKIVVGMAKDIMNNNLTVNTDYEQ